MNLPAMTPPVKRAQLAKLRELMDWLESQPVVTPCRLCAEFDPPNGYCGRWRAEVPKDAQDKGCDAWTEPVPF